MPATTCDTIILFAARMKALRALREAKSVYCATVRYHEAVRKAAEMHAIAMNTRSGSTPSINTVLDAALATMPTPADVVENGDVTYQTVREKYFGVAIPDFDTIEPTCEVPGAFFTNQRLTMLEHGDTTVRLQWARFLKHQAACYDNERVADKIKTSIYGKIISFAVRYYNSLERIGLHETVADEYLNLFESAADADTGTEVYDAATNAINELTLSSYVPQVIMDSHTRGLVDAYALVMNTVTGIRKARYEITGPHPELPVPPEIPEPPYRC
jgi:hypothetical protein